MQSANEFKKSGYIVIPKLVAPTDALRLYDYTVKNANRGNLDDGQVPGSPSFYQDKEVVSLERQLRPAIEKSIAVPLSNVFCYHRVYRTGAVLRAHKDSARAEISASINLGQKGEPWDLWLLDYDENARRIVLEPGDALIYHGCKLTHWRGKLVDSDFVSQIMFHFVEKNGKNALAAKTEIFRKIRKKFREIRGLGY